MFGMNGFLCVFLCIFFAYDAHGETFYLPFGGNVDLPCSAGPIVTEGYSSVKWSYYNGELKIKIIEGRQYAKFIITFNTKNDFSIEMRSNLGTLSLGGLGCKNDRQYECEGTRSGQTWTFKHKVNLGEPDFASHIPVMVLTGDSSTNQLSQGSMNCPEILTHQDHVTISSNVTSRPAVEFFVGGVKEDATCTPEGSCPGLVVCSLSKQYPVSDTQVNVKIRYTSDDGDRSLERTFCGIVKKSVPTTVSKAVPVGAGTIAPHPDGRPGAGTDPSDGSPGAGTDPSDGSPGAGTDPSDGSPGAGTGPSDGSPGASTGPSDGSPGASTPPPDGGGTGGGKQGAQSRGASTHDRGTQILFPTVGLLVAALMIV